MTCRLRGKIKNETSCMCVCVCVCVCVHVYVIKKCVELRKCICEKYSCIKIIILNVLYK